MWRVVVHKRNGLFRLILARFKYKAHAEMFPRDGGNEESEAAVRKS